ncbi:MAG: DUF1573 domain-containing protein [Crocinitomicaceae bacterium]
MRKNTIYLLSGLFLIASCNNSEEDSTSLVQYSEADKSELPEGSVPSKGPLSKPTSIQYEEVMHDFGDVFYPSDNKYTFKFTNTGTEPLIISEAKASCGCTVPRKPEEPVLPGEVGELDVVFKPKEGQVGQDVTKKITITANTSPSQTFLNIKAKVKSGM